MLRRHPCWSPAPLSEGASRCNSYTGRASAHRAAPVTPASAMPKTAAVAVSPKPSPALSTSRPRDATPADQGNRRPHQALAQEPGRRSAGPIPCLPPEARRGDARGTASQLRHAAAQGAFAAAGHRSATRSRHREIACCDVEHSRGSREIHRIQPNGRSYAVTQTQRREDAGAGQCRVDGVRRDVVRRG